MSKIFVINKKQLQLIALLGIAIIAAVIYATNKPSEPVGGTAEETKNARVIHLVTGEFKTTTEDGKEIEAYRWDPGTIHVEKGENVKLSIYGVNGKSHPFIIEGLGVKGEVKKGKETVVHFKAEKEGNYRVICLTHSDMDHNGPMIGYIVVD